MIELVHRFMRQEDVPSLYKMYLDCPFSIGPKVRGQKWLEDVCNDDGQWKFTLESYRIVVGLATIWWSDQYNGVLSTTMWLSPDKRGKGLGFRTMEFLWEFAESNVPMFRKFTGSVYGFNTASLKMCEKFFGHAESVVPNEVFHDGKYWPVMKFAKYRENK